MNGLQQSDRCAGFRSILGVDMPCVKQNVWKRIRCGAVVIHKVRGRVYGLF